MDHDDSEHSDFEILAAALGDQGLLSSPSEVHGLMMGFIGTGSGIDEGQVLHLVLSHLELDSGVSSEFKAALLDIYAGIVQQLSAGEFEFELLLPDDDIDELYSRLQALSAWCQGFLVGFGTGSGGLNEDEFSDEVQEAIRDIVDVANVESEIEEEEEAEAAYSEVCEYIRVASMLIYSEFVSEDEQGSSLPNSWDVPDQLH